MWFGFLFVVYSSAHLFIHSVTYILQCPYITWLHELLLLQDIQCTPTGNHWLPLGLFCPTVLLPNGVFSLTLSVSGLNSLYLCTLSHSYLVCVCASGVLQQHGHVDSSSFGTVPSLSSGYSWHPHTSPPDQSQCASAHRCGRTDVHQ